MHKQQAANGQVQPLVFFQLTKVDEAQRLVYGRAVQEVADKSGEIFDYASSKPNFEKWSKDQFTASLGKSSGNVRAMHKDVAAGIVVNDGLIFHDDERAIDMISKVTDDNEWGKVLSGTYTGFSIGGKYAKRWTDPENPALTRYTAEPSEISLVDRPCVPTATFFEVQKADGTLAKVDFVAPVEELEQDSGDMLAKARAALTEEVEALPVAALRKGLLDAGVATAVVDELSAQGLVVAYVDELIKQQAEGAADDATVDVPGSAEQVDEFLKMLAAQKMTFADALTIVKAVLERKPELLGGVYGEVVAKAVDTSDLAKRAFGNTRFADEVNKKYPLDTPEQVRAAQRYWAVTKAQERYDEPTRAAITKAIETAATKHKLGKVELLVGDLTSKDLLKNLVTCGDFAYALQSLCKLQQCVEYEAATEGDNSPLPAGLREWIRQGGDLLGKMVAEEVAEEYADNAAIEAAHASGSVPEVLRMSEAVGALQKRATVPGLSSVSIDLSKTTPAMVVSAKETDLAKRLETEAAENAELRKQLEGNTATLAKLAQDIELLKQQPVRTSLHLRAVGKGDDLTPSGELTKVEPVKNAPTKEDQDVATMIKQAHATGGQPLLAKY